MSFELFVASRYLRAKRKTRFISIVTVISVIGVATGVAALVIAMAINNGVQQDLQRHLLAATAHVNLMEKEPGFGIENWRSLVNEFKQVDHVDAVAPALYGEVMITTPIRSRGCIIKGIDPASEIEVAELLRHLEEGSLNDLVQPQGAMPGIIIGRRLADYVGARLQTEVSLINPQGESTPFGNMPVRKRFRVVGIFNSGFFEYDNSWVYTTLESAQQTLAIEDVINAIEVRLDDIDQAPAVAEVLREEAGPKYDALTWFERNRTVFNALQMEKLVTAIAIGLIMLVAALNILTSLVMMVMEKNKDIAILKSMGAGRAQIRRIFMWQGLVIGVTGTLAGLVLGHFLAWVCDKYHLLPLEPEVYGLEYVPFAPHLWDGVVVALAALAISYLITIYPSSSAARVAPVEVLRYE
ncbi:MAG: ABC transporter permease [Bryobacterales bacterium]|nr:ABC transporter permease [Acidobacteriota bacterium]MCB9384849.1 ABC transporter permease [Bryobacterales bacterium]